MSGHWRIAAFDEIVRAKGSGSSGLPKSEWQDMGKFPVIGQGAEEIEGWTDRKDLVIETVKPLVLYGGHTQRAKFVDAPFVPGPNVRILEPLNGLDARFLFYFLSQLEIDEKGYADHFPLVRKSEVPLPPLDEQMRIVAKLDQAFAALDRARVNAEANLADVAALVSSELESIFKLDSLPSDQVHAIADVFFTVTGNTPSKAEAVFYGADIPFVKPPELMGGVVGNTGDNLSELGGASARLAPKGTVLVSCIGNLGKIGLLDRKSAFNQQINAILPIERAIPEFVMYQCRSPQFMKQLERRAGGTTVSIVNKSQFNELNFWLPEVNVQATIVSKFKRLEETAGALNGRCSAKLTDIVALRQSLLQAAFSGQLS